MIAVKFSVSYVFFALSTHYFAKVDMFLAAKVEICEMMK